MLYFILLGGSWINIDWDATSGDRHGSRPGARFSGIGFRIVRRKD